MSESFQRVLAITVRLHGDRWHGEGDWPPSPFRLFQALVAGAYSGRWRREGDRAANERAFEWLESLPAPIVLAPTKREATTVQYYVPNNDLDSVENDPSRAAEIRTAKLVKSHLIDPTSPFVYLWTFEGDPAEATEVATLCERLHTFGHGVDAAYARAEFLDGEAARSLLETFRGSVARPAPLSEGAAGGTPLPVPTPGSLESLHRRHRETKTRLEVRNVGRKRETLFRQPPKAQMALVPYNRPATVLLFELRRLAEPDLFLPIFTGLAAPVATSVRDLLAARLGPVYEAKIVERAILGREAGRRHVDSRIRIVPLPSLGTRFTDPSIRRVVVEVPPDCPISANDVVWALAGESIAIEIAGGGARAARLVRSFDLSMLERYRRKSTRWQSVTPIVLPANRPSGHVGGRARLESEQVATFALLQALRHAEVSQRVISVRVQREPLSPRGLLVNEFVPGRFTPAQMYHAEVIFADERGGITAIGDGRWLGLGLMRPVSAKGETTRVDTAESGEVVDEDDGEGDAE